MGGSKDKTFPLTQLVHAGTIAFEGGKPVNPPIYRCSTVVFENTAQQQDLKERRSSTRLFTYGARGNPTNFALEDAIAALEGGFRTKLYPTGLAAMGMVVLSYLKPGDHILIMDGVYQPMRILDRVFLSRYGVHADYFPHDALSIEEYIKPNTRMIYVECPSSLTFDLCDLPALCTVAQQKGILVAADNTWGSGVQYSPLRLGADISIIAATKYLSGHSDVMMGAVTTNRAAWLPLSETADAFGMTVSPDDSYLVLRGTRSLAPRLAMHQQHALQVAEWLKAHPKVRTVLCPALPDHPSYEIWKRDCIGTNGLLTIELTTSNWADANHFVDALKLFKIGASWGGYESLATTVDIASARTQADWPGRGSMIRLHVGLESPGDLIEDLGQAFDAINI